MWKKCLLLGIVLLSFKAYANNSWNELQWGMSSEEVLEKVNIQLKYEDDYFEVLLLPKNSVYQNEFDELLLFCKEQGIDLKKKFGRLGLTRRLIKLENVSWKEYYTSHDIRPVRYTFKSNSIRSPEQIRGSFEYIYYIPDEQINNWETKCIKAFDYSYGYYESFPSKFSLEIQALFNFYEDNYEHNYTIAGETYNAYYTLITNNNETFICVDSIYSDNYGTYKYWEVDPYDKYENKIPATKYLRSIKKEFNEFSQSMKLKMKQEAELLAQKEKEAKEELARQQRELAYKNNPGPFGTWWGMKKDDLQYIGEWVDNKNLYRSSTAVYRLLQKKYDELYETEEGITEWVAFEPEKNSDRIILYNAIFDIKLGLVQVISVAFGETMNTSRVNNVLLQKNNCKQQFESIKSTLIDQYGIPVDSKDEYVYWITDKNTKIELIKTFSHYDAYDFDGRIYDFVADYVLLVYSSSDYDNTMQRIQLYRTEKEKKLKEKEEEQNSYF